MAPKQEVIQITEKNKYSTKDITKYVRQTLRQKYKHIKFSVRCEYYSCGSSMHITLLESHKVRFLKKPEEVEERQVLIIKDHTHRTEEEARNFIKQRLESEYYQINQYHLSTDWGLTDKGKEILKDVLEIANKYNWDKSDIQTDYFDVNYYLHINLGSYEKPFKDGVEE